MTSLHHMGTIGYTQHYRFSNYNKMIWAYCYNVTQKSMQWEKVIMPHKSLRTVMLYGAKRDYVYL